ncbi:MAG: hypothetical protein JO348_12655 [Alphaproteobacteria bacterium]|nr:hypothetical protein [Alphaproteobacteria bacterium]
MSTSSEIRNLRLLVVGGRPASVQILRTAFSLLGMRSVTVVAESDKAIDALRSQHFSAIFADAGAEPVGRMTFVRAARRSKGLLNPMTPLFVIYTNARQKHVEYARDEGVTDVLTHPVSAATIQRKLEVALGAPRPFIAAPSFFGPDRRTERRNVWSGDERRKRLAKKTKIVLPDAPVA